MSHKFNRRIFTFKLFLKDLGFLVKKLPRLISASLRGKEISKQFMEKIMTVITAVNGCTVCTWFHAKSAVSSGMSEEEVKNMLNLQFEADASDFESLGLLYAQHYAETNRNPDKEMTEKLFEFYGDKKAKLILLIIRIVFFGNLFGNTFDAFLSRLKGDKAKNSNIVFELFFFIINAPFMLPLLLFIRLEKAIKNMKQKRNQSNPLKQLKVHNPLKQLKVHELFVQKMVQSMGQVCYSIH